jgi:uncharacterized protein
MIIRFVLKNIFSFGEQKEFNSMPNPRLKTLSKHKYAFKGFEILKMSSIYGANGAGKSNLINALKLFQRVVTREEIPYRLKNSSFKFQKDTDKTPQLLAIEFIQDDTAFYYALEMLNGIISTEELYESGLGMKEDKLVYERKTDENGHSSIQFLEAFERDEKSQILKSVLLQDFVKPTEPILKLISNRENPYLKAAKNAYAWFSETLTIISPDSKPNALVNRIDIDSDFKLYAEEIMGSFNIGITALVSEKKAIEDFLGKDNDNNLDELVKKLESTPKKMIGLRTNKGDELILVKEDNKIFVKQLKLQHTGQNNIAINFDLEEESDGTIRLLDFIPAFKDVVSKTKVFVIDEIERSIHPLLIKELIRKFSTDDASKGQLIFTTHESNLLDQDIFRQDEIWFAEKDKNGSTDLYPLSNFKEHKTLDIQKGYLNGRYGSIPFLANLQDLNWHKYDTTQ